MNFIEEKPHQISLLAKRELERQLNIQKKKEDSVLCSAENERIEYFQSVFKEKYDGIVTAIDSTEVLQKNQLPDHFNAISKDILLLQKYVAASSLFLRNYDIQKYQQTLQDLSSKAKSCEDEFLPKKKFGFKNKSKLKPEKINGHTTDDTDSSTKKIIEVKENFCGFSDIKGQKLCLRGDEILKMDVTLERLQDCSITLLGCPSTLHLNHIKNCTILSGPVSTSIFAENCTDSSVSLACQQLRLHSSKNVKIFLHVTSRAIMEDCKEIMFAPYNFHYQDKERDFSVAGLDMSVNNWKCIDDFNWLNVEKPSPNWREFASESSD